MGFPTTAKGKAFWTYAFTPDTKFDAYGKYHTKFRIGGQEAIDLAKRVDDLLDQSLAEATENSPQKKIKKNNTVYTEVLDDNGTPTGELEFAFKQNAVITKKDKTTMNMRVAVFDAKGKPITSPVEVGNGSTVKVSYDPYKWVTPTLGAGVTLRFKGLQIIELVERSGSNADGFGFGEEDGYSHDNNNNNSDDNNEFFQEESNNENQDEDF